MANPKLAAVNSTPVESSVGKNVKMVVEGNTLTITVDLKADFGKSASGKTNIVATTAGNVAIPGSDAILGLNIYRK